MYIRPDYYFKKMHISQGLWRRFTWKRTMIIISLQTKSRIGMAGIIISIIIFSIIGLYWQRHQNQYENLPTDVTTSAPIQQEKKDFDTRNLVISTLGKMGCEHFEEDDIRISFTYQGENFVIDAVNDCMFINVYDPWWFELPMNGDIEDFSRMQKAVNLANCEGTNTVMYTYNREKGLVGVHSKKNILFTKEISELDKYLIGVLDSFFRTQRFIVSEMDKLKNKEVYNL